MELRQLKYLIAIARAGSISRAAQDLHMTQPPLSAAIQQLEQEMGSRLFHRGSRGVELTATGQYLAREAEHILAAVDEATSRVRALEQGLEGVVTIGAMPAVSWELLPAVLSEFADAAPGVDIQLRELAQRELIELTAKGKLDLGFLVTSSAAYAQQRYEGVMRIERLISVDIVAALSAEYRDAPDPIPLSELVGVPFALPSRASDVLGVAQLTNVAEALSLSEAITQAFERHGLPRPRIIDTVTLQEAMPLVIAGIAASAGPYSLRRVVSDGVVIKQIEAGPAPYEIAVMYRNERELSPAAHRLLGTARQIGREMDEAWREGRAEPDA